MAPLDLVMI